MTGRTRIMRVFASTGLFATLTLFTATADVKAARAPQSPVQLQAEADLVVVAEVTDVKIQQERSRVETGHGNYDWGVYSRLLIRKVEKGDSVGLDQEIVARCFVVRSRKSAMEYLSLQSHSPIPETGQIVRAYLQRDGDAYEIVHPNGYASTSGASLVQSAAVKQLRQGGYTYLLPLELWISGGLFAALVASVVCVIVNVRRYLARRRAARKAGNPMKPQFSLVGLLVMTFFVAGGFALGAQRFALYVVLVAFLTLIWFTIRPPRSTFARQLWWGVNLTSASSLIAALIR